MKQLFQIGESVIVRIPWRWPISATISAVDQAGLDYGRLKVRYQSEATTDVVEEWVSAKFVHHLEATGK